jgi:predicted transposase YdaD
MIDYGFRIAIDDLDFRKIKPDEQITVEFPSQIIIFLKRSETIPDELNLTIKMPYTEKKIKYIVPTFKIWEHDPNYYKKQKLYIMLPLRIITLSEELERLKKRKLKEEEKTKLQDEYRKKITGIIENIINELKETLDTDEIIIEELNKILLELSNLAGELFSEELKDIEREVNEMAKMIIDPEIYKRGLKEGLEKGIEQGIEKGIEQGIEKGIEKGMAQTIIKLLCKKLGGLSEEYKEKILSLDRATLESIAENIFGIESLADIDRFLNK